MAKDLEEFTKVVTEDANTVYTAVAEATYQSINDYAGEEIANDAVEIKSVICLDVFCWFLKMVSILFCSRP